MPLTMHVRSLTCLPCLAVSVCWLLCSTPTALAEVYKCADAQGRVSYSGTPCAPDSVRQQTVNASPAAAGIGGVSNGAARENAVSATAPAHAYAPEKFCPSERDISNLENRATSITLDDTARAFIRDEVRRARACSHEETRYTREDWVRVQRGIDAQSRPHERDREEGRATAIDVHSLSASAQERERIENDKTREVLREARRQREAAIQDAAWRPVARCDGSACWDKGGNRYGKAANGNYLSAAGQVCTLNGTRLHCP